jgi:hypothetical protein
VKHPFLFIIALLLVACNPPEKKENVTENQIIGKWKVIDFNWEILTELSQKEKQAYHDYAQTQKRIFQIKSHFAFNPDHTYVMDFKGNGGDTGTWSVTPDHQLAHYSTRYKIHDTIRIESIAENEIVFLIASNEQLARVTLQRK